MRAVIAKVTGKQVEMPSLEEAAEGLSDDRREELKVKYKSQIDAYKAKRALSSEGDESTPSIMEATEAPSMEE